MELGHIPLFLQAFLSFIRMTNRLLATSSNISSQPDSGLDSCSTVVSCQCECLSPSAALSALLSCSAFQRTSTVLIQSHYYDLPFSSSNSHLPEQVWIQATPSTPHLPNPSTHTHTHTHFCFLIWRFHLVPPCLV